MADVQIRAVGPSAAPLDYVVPGAHEIDISMLSAHFDGSAASVSWLPTIEILSSGGTSCGIIPMDSPVAAGASVEATWGPFSAGKGAAAAGAGLPWAIQRGTGTPITVAGGGHHGQFTPSTTDFFTNSPSVFQLAASGTFPGIDGIQALELGHYLLMGSFTITAFGAGAINLAVNLADGLQSVPWTGDYSIGNIVSSTPIYGSDTSDVYLNTIIMGQATTASGGPANPNVWNIDNFGTNSATIVMNGTQVFQLDTIDTGLI